MKIRFVSLISNDNRPLYIQAFVPKSDNKNEEMNELLKYNFLSHMSLDVFESPFCPPAALATQGKPSLLFIQDGILVYGSETQTGLKIIIGCSRMRDENNDDSLGNLEGYAENDVMEVSELTGVSASIRKEYLRYSCNPFLDVKRENDEIKSEKFDNNIKRMVEEFNSKKV